MKQLVFVVMAGTLLSSAPALSQPRTFIGVIERDRHYDTVEDLVERAGCHKDWEKFALWNERSAKKPNWLKKLFSGKPKPSLGTRIYLSVSSLEGCRLSPKEYAKAEAVGQVAAETLKRSVVTTHSPPPPPVSQRIVIPRPKKSRPVSRNRLALKPEKESPRVSELEKSLKDEKDKNSVLEQKLEKVTSNPPPPPNHRNWHIMLYAMGVVSGLLVWGFAALLGAKPKNGKGDRQKVIVSRD